MAESISCLVILINILYLESLSSKEELFKKLCAEPLTDIV